MSTYTLQIIFAGLCALVPRSDGPGVTAVFVDEQRGQCSGITHKAILSTRLAYLGPGRNGKKPTEIVVGPDGQQDAVFKLDGVTITLKIPTPAPAFTTKKAWFRDTELPHWFIPGHQHDIRWMVDSSPFIPNPRIDPARLRLPYKDVAAIVTISQGTLATSSIIKDDLANYITWQFFDGARKPLLPHPQALADEVMVEIPVELPPSTRVTVIFTPFDTTKSPEQIELQPTPGNSTIQVSITNLPDQRPEDPMVSHIECACKLAVDPGTNCKDNPRVVKKVSASSNGIGIFCPVLGLKQ
jgi:hypothetical protein